MKSIELRTTRKKLEKIIYYLIFIIWIYPISLLNLNSFPKGYDLFISIFWYFIPALIIFLYVLKVLRNFNVSFAASLILFFILIFSGMAKPSNFPLYVIHGIYGLILVFDKRKEFSVKFNIRTVINIAIYIGIYIILGYLVESFFSIKHLQ